MARRNARVVSGSPFFQGEDEVIARGITIPTTWGTETFTNIVNTLYEDPEGDNDDVSDTKLSGVSTSSNQVITTQSVGSLTAGTDYRLEVKFDTSEGNTMEFYMIIKAVR